MAISPPLNGGAALRELAGSREFHLLISWFPWLGLASVASLAWAFLALSERSMGDDGLLAALMGNLMRPAEWAPYLATAAGMWIVMMVAMMVPAVLPMARAVERVGRGAETTYPGFFSTGYLASWSLFAIVAAALQWGLHQSGWLFGHGLALSPALAGAVLIAAGAYQLTALKEACLRHCRSPLGFILEHWRAGKGGAFKMGIRHGLYCVGCCWLLMLLMFAGGAMSVLWMAAICAFILAERTLPEGPWVSRAPGLLLAGSGVALWASALL